MFPDIVRAIGKLYTQKLVWEDFPYFSGFVKDLVPEVKEVLVGEYVITYSDGEVNHQIRLYFDGGIYEAHGIPNNGEISFKTGAKS